MSKLVFLLLIFRTLCSPFPNYDTSKEILAKENPPIDYEDKPYVENQPEGSYSTFNNENKTILDEKLDKDDDSGKNRSRREVFYPSMIEPMEAEVRRPEDIPPPEEYEENNPVVDYPVPNEIPTGIDQPVPNGLDQPVPNGLDQPVPNGSDGPVPYQIGESAPIATEDVPVSSMTAPVPSPTSRATIDRDQPAPIAAPIPNPAEVAPVPDPTATIPTNEPVPISSEQPVPIASELPVVIARDQQVPAISEEPVTIVRNETVPNRNEGPVKIITDVPSPFTSYQQSPTKELMPNTTNTWISVASDQPTFINYNDNEYSTATPKKTTTKTTTSKPKTKAAKPTKVTTSKPKETTTTTTTPKYLNLKF